jgi:hypothetical protein
MKMKALLAATVLCGSLVAGHVAQAQSFTTEYQVWYSPTYQTSGACAYTGGWSCLTAPAINVGYTTINEAFGASFYNGAKISPYWDGNTLYWTVYK